MYCRVYNTYNVYNKTFLHFKDVYLIEAGCIVSGNESGALRVCCGGTRGSSARPVASQPIINHNLSAYSRNRRGSY